MEADPSAWVDFSAAIVVASVAFAGLIFVAISINLDAVVTLGGVADLALAGVTVLTGIAISAVFLLVPGQPRAVLGSELVLLGAAMLAATYVLYSRSYRATTAAYRKGRIAGALLQSAPGASFAICGASLLAGLGGGLYWLVPGWIVGIAAGVLQAWVLLVEVKR